ncbi:MAG: hypothetical protein HFG55_09440 [Lachnospiraceae bacterium]|nr:hypothetical protein [Lachnospiraceae bacterium]
MKQKKIFYYGLPLLGTLLCLWYIKEATCDIVYSDYIRIVNKYLPDVWNPENFFRPDVLTRIPIYYPVRALNVILFRYNTTFEMALGALGLGLSGMVLGRYCEWKRVNWFWYVFLLFLLFGLNKWEMLTNGTGWAHFLAFACFYYHYLVFDRVLYGQEKPGDRIRLLVLPPVVSLAIAGPYCAVYSAVMVLAYGFAGVRSYLLSQKKKATAMDLRFCVAGIVSVVIPLLLYMWSNSYAYEDHDGAIKVGLVEMLGAQPVFFVNFLLKSLASMVIGGETLNKWVAEGIVGDGALYLLGAVLAGGYLLALVINLRCRLYEKTLLPLLLLFAGMGNHGIILISRYIFAREEYGMSSRYALQYQAGLLGIVLTFALAWRLAEKAEDRKATDTNTVGSVRKPGGTGRQESRPMGGISRWLAAALCLLLLAGHGYTDYVEIRTAPYREAYGENIAAMALQYESLDDDTLRETFDYRKGRKESGADVRRALRILKENGWNVFGRQENR